MKLHVTVLSAALLALTASVNLYAQAPKAEEGKAQTRRFDCSKAKDPKACEERVAKLRERRDKARKACEGKTGTERRECMEKAFCAGEQDPAKCEANLKALAEQRERIRAACQGKTGEELKTCIREQRAAKKQGP
jgi:Spy/CpxP family protein refolding chaperone